VPHPDLITYQIKQYIEYIALFNNQIVELEKTRQDYDLEKVNFLDQLMNAVSELSVIKSRIPVVTFKKVEKEKLKKKLMARVKKEKAKLEQKKVEEKKKKLSLTTELPKERIEEIKHSQDLERIKRFRKDLEELNKQLRAIT